MRTDWPVPTGKLPPTVERVDVWAVPVDLHDEGAAWAGRRHVLSPDERQRADQFLLDQPRRRFIVARAALRMLLGRYLETPADQVALENDSNGKPRLAQPHNAANVRFNVAHSGELALIAVAVGCEVGVDVENVRVVRHAEQIARRFFHPDETTAILATPAARRDKAFLRYWTAKEAVLKAIGCGVTGSLASFRVPSDKSQTHCLDLPPQLSRIQRRCQLHELAPCDGYLGALAWLGAPREVHCFSFES